MADDFRNTINGAGALGNVLTGGSATGNLEVAGDADIFQVSLIAGLLYQIQMRGQGSGGGTLGDPLLDLRNAANVPLASDDDSGAGFDAFFQFRAPATSTYFLRASGAFTLFGTYTVSVGVGFGDAQNNVITGTAVADAVDGGGGNDTIDGGAGNDSLAGGSGNDIVRGGDGNDTLNGSGGTVVGGGDSVFGGNGNDYIYAWLGTSETIVGGAGIDTLDTTAFTGNYVVDLATGVTTFSGESFTQMENLFSGAGNDTLTGSAAANLIDGGAGNDTIDGGAGNDSLRGERQRHPARRRRQRYAEQRRRPRRLQQRLRRRRQRLHLRGARRAGDHRRRRGDRHPRHHRLHGQLLRQPGQRR